MSTWLKLSFKRRDYHEFTGAEDIQRINWTECDSSDVIGLLRRAQLLKDENFAELVLDGIAQYIQYNSIVKSKLADTSVASTLDSLLNQYMTSSRVCLKIFRVILALLSEEKCKKKLASPSFCYRLVKVCQLYKDDDSLLLISLQIMFALTSDGIDDQVANKLMVSGGCELLCGIIHQYFNSDNGLVEWSCRIISNMAFDNAACSDKFNEIGMSEMTASILPPYYKQLHIYDDHGASVNETNKSRNILFRKLQYVFLSIGSVCRQNDAIREKMVNLEVVDMVMRIFDYSVDETNKVRTTFQMQKVSDLGNNEMTFIESLLWCISNMCYLCSSSQIRFSELGICSLLVKVLKQYQTSGTEKPVIECLRCIRNIGHNSSLSLSKFYSSGNFGKNAFS